MPVGTGPLSAANLTAALQALPDQNGDTTNVSVNLLFRGVVFHPNDLYTALTTQYAGRTIEGLDSVPGQGTFGIVIST